MFPKTIEYYQNELTRMLEGERYGEAVRMLRFLLQCRHDDPQYKEEWQSLLGWLTVTFPEEVEAALGENRQDSDENGDEETESDMLRRHVRAKAAGDSKFTDKLLDMLAPHAPIEKQMMALEQIAHLDKRTVGERLKRWLTESRLHPLVQFRALQVLRSIQESGEIEIRKLGQTMRLAIAETPLAYEDYPERIRSVLDRVREVAESNQPGMIGFADETWRDFLAFVYGTSVYEELLAVDETGRDVWAAALHHTVQETAFGSADEEELAEWYGLTGAPGKAYHKALQVIKLFATVSNPGDS
ncbi:hypothetical protein [Paenibacillus flagellatus]|uniref:Uncharacterized protein n=1 Tax=Paenibacillus flagellatus TaxID=2211139 RepID=A0A2V5K3I5_9BACL|nr:hypothetical protein [Paenibacillus flagellatus]PYI52193.1 hypothetical protein DLM86_22230 [Paenibacillus flagellatus]